jgi:DNA polymerase elongation subunit (family B)
MENNSVLIYDIETDGLNVNTAKCKWFGAYSYQTKEYYMLPFTEMDWIKRLISQHNVLIGFNNVAFDNPILENQHNISFEYKNVIDLIEVCRKRLVSMGIKTPNYKLKTIVQTLGLNKDGKGDIDYKIFQKDDWTQEERNEIKIYLKQDIIITMSLFEWFRKQFEPIKKFLSDEDKFKFIDVKSSLASLSFRVVCNLAGLKCEFKGKDEIIERATFSGGHHIEPRWDRAKGNIVSIDFVSAYPHALMMGNLFSHSIEGWNGNSYFNLQGTYNNKEFGKVESALRQIFLERIEAKRNGDKEKNLSYKIIINSLYGLTGNTSFKTLYNHITASDCTSMVRTWMKKLSKILEENGFQVLYGFTDNIMVKIPETSSKEKLMYIVDKYIKEVKSNVPFPQDTFEMEIDKEMKFIWFVAKNCYLWVDLEDKVGYRSTLLNKNTPEIIMNMFRDYMSKKIVRDLDVDFTKEELIEELKRLLENNLELSAEKYNCKDYDSYKSKTALECQISEKYGEGRHLLIPNSKNIGVGRAKSTKKKVGVRYCSIQDFKDNNLTINDIYMDQLLKHVKSFIKKEIKKETSKQVELFK